MKSLDDKIKLNMLGKGEILGSDMETRVQNLAYEDSYHSRSNENGCITSIFKSTLKLILVSSNLVKIQHIYVV